jgi:hypothetical protein
MAESAGKTTFQKGVARMQRGQKRAWLRTVAGAASLNSTFTSSRSDRFDPL